MRFKKLRLDELNRISNAEFKSVDKNKISIIIDNVRSLNNIGSIFRTADAFLLQKIYLCGITATPPHREIQKTAIGATESVDWEYYKDILILIDELKKDSNNVILAIEQTENSIYLNKYEKNNNKNYYLIFGNEVDGVNQDVIELCDNTIEIPQFGTKHSLNIATCTSLVIWDFMKDMGYLNNN